MNDKWIADGGNIYIDVVKIKCSKDFRLGKNYEYRDAVAFNVGTSMANHIVKLHNDSLSQ